MMIPRSKLTRMMSQSFLDFVMPGAGLASDGRHSGIRTQRKKRDPYDQQYGAEYKGRAAGCSGSGKP